MTPPLSYSPFFFFNDTATPEIYTLSLHDALPISTRSVSLAEYRRVPATFTARQLGLVPISWTPAGVHEMGTDRKSTRLNSSHQIISYAVFCLKKKNTEIQRIPQETRSIHRLDQRH